MQTSNYRKRNWPSGPTARSAIYGRIFLQVPLCTGTEHGRTHLRDLWLLLDTEPGFASRTPNGLAEPFLKRIVISDISTQPSVHSTSLSVRLVLWSAGSPSFPASLCIFSHRYYLYRNLCTFISSWHLLLRGPRLTQHIIDPQTTPVDTKTEQKAAQVVQLLGVPGLYFLSCCFLPFKNKCQLQSKKSNIL